MCTLEVDGKSERTLKETVLSGKLVLKHYIAII